MLAYFATANADVREFLVSIEPEATRFAIPNGNAARTVRRSFQTTAARCFKTHQCADSWHTHAMPRSQPFSGNDRRSCFCQAKCPDKPRFLTTVAYFFSPDKCTPGELRRATIGDRIAQKLQLLTELSRGRCHDLESKR